MFTGLVEQVGSVRHIVRISDGLLLKIDAAEICRDVAVGDSVCVNGVCLTVVDYQDGWFAVQAVGETVARSNLQELKQGMRVNLERALKAGSRLGGHFVQGHVDCTGDIMALESRQPGYWMTLNVPRDVDVFLVEKGSVAIDGISLTVAEKTPQKCAVAVIPLTFENTTLCEKSTGDRVNIEVDILGKYVYQMLRPHQKSQITQDALARWGYE